MSSLGSPRILDVNLLLYGTMLPIRLNAHTGRPGIHAMSASIYGKPAGLPGTGKSAAEL